MATNIYKTEQINLTTNVQQRIGFWLDGIWYDQIEGGTLTTFSDYMQIYIAVTNDATIDWSAVPVEKEANILEMSNIREGFDSEKGKYSFDDIEIRAINLSSFWSDYIFTSPSYSKIEIRIIYYSLIDPGYYTKEAIFYGIVRNDDYNVKNNYTYGNTTTGKITKEYTFKAYSFLKSLEDITPDTFRVYLESHLTGSAFEESAATARQIYEVGEETITYDFALTETFKFGKITDIIQWMIAQLNITINTFTWTCDLHFGASGSSALQYDIDDLYIPWRGLTKGYTGKIFSYKTEDTENKADDTEWSLYRFQNCADILSNLLNTFGLVYRMDFSTGGTYDCQFSLDVTFLGRLDTSASITVDAPIESVEENYNTRDIVRGCNMDIVGIGDYNNTTKDDLSYTILFNIQPLGYTATMTAYDYESTGKSWEHALYLKIGSYMHFVTNIYVGAADYHSDLEIFENEGRLTIGKAISAYYTNATSGIFGKPRKTLKVELSEIKAVYGGVYAYKSLKPTYRWEIITGETYMITQTEKNILNDKTILELVDYS